MKRRRDQGGDRVSLDVLSAVMDAAGYDDATEFETCLYDVIDPDALDSLFHQRTRGGRVEFTIDGFEVRVHSNGTVEATPE
ncbi:hypothetical protein ZOD2009_19423 [Haladaptatus paucihalophilus DX253]|nr:MULTISPECIES: HalOD1 output domain-containing protein [Haladaptatus]EFW90260.1 hypothetical protein ZOD2009_19423 [Haladaptatus paucihalophilus DX253]ODR81398.1 hypothetical protein BG842_10195 [Haladaptatus sp. W1]GKZ12220.1 hypothetical protein HAL_01010 [Haladaptatus sp. T7]